jgi:hypothetical protein
VTLPSIGTTLGAQSANQSIEATSKADGSITVVGPSGLQGSTITCVVTVPTAPAGAAFTATLGANNGMGVALSTWQGAATAGKFQISVGQTLVVTGTGLASNTAYTCTFSSILDVGPVQVVLPEPNYSTATLTRIAPTPVSIQFIPTGGTQTWTAPATVTSITVDMAGARGGNFAAVGGGGGARLQATMAVIPGNTYTIWVGQHGNDGGVGIGTGSGGFGIGPGGTSSQNGGSFAGAGGGASGISPTTSAGAATAIAGGGGGAEGTVGGGGGFPAGVAAPASGGAGGGQGGTQSAGGAGGVGATITGNPGASLQGGNAAALTMTAPIGGGGGGFFGGGTGSQAGGNTSGGGGGSSFHGAPLSAIVDTPGFENGDGYVTLSYSI